MQKLYLCSILCFVILGIASYCLAADPGDIVINEIYYDSPGSDVSTFTELKGDPGTDLNGYDLIGVNGNDGAVYRTISLTGTIPADSLFVIGEDAGVANYDTIADVDWQNGPDNVILTSPLGDTVDAVGYGPTDTSGWDFVGEGVPAPDVASGSSLGRYPDGTDTDDNSVDFAVFGSPTPGEANEYPPPLSRSIYQIQYTTDPSGDSPYKDSTVVTSGIVTAGSGVFSSGGFYLQDGDGAWNGILIYHDADSVGQGDSVTVTGVVDEYSGKTEIKGVVELTINSTGNTLPNPALITPGEVDTSEAYEGVLIKVESVVVVDTMDENGEWKVEGSDTCMVDDDGQYSYIPSLGDTLDITGIVNYSYLDFKIEPRYDQDIVLLSDQPPVISNVSQDPPWPTSGDTVLISGRVTDAEAGKSVSSVYLLYSIDASPYDSTAMLDNGIPPDQTSGDSIYTAQILPQANGTLVEYYLKATDNANQITTDPSDAPATTYSYTVGELPPTIVINEIYYDSPGADVSTFTELKGDPGTSLDGYKLIGVNGNDGAVYRTISLTGTIPADSLFVIAQDAGVANYDTIANVDWQQGPDNVILTSPLGDTVDAVGYGDVDTTTWYFVGEGIPAPDVASGSSLGRYPDGTDTDDNSVDFAVFGSPTPGEANEYPPPLTRSIYQIQYTTDPSGDSPYKDSTVVTSGIVTAGSGVFSSGGFYLQDGDGAWNGILIYHDADSVGQGDSVTVTGVVDEYSGKTEIKGVVELTINSTGNTLPNPALITPGEVDTSEAYEGVLIKVESVVVVDTMDENGEWKVEGSDTCMVDDDGQYSYIPSLGDTLDITGIVNYSYGDFKIEPRYDADIDTTIVGVRFSDLSAVPEAFSLSQNYPNPFNPVTQISFSLPERVEVNLSVFNIVGEKLAELVNGKLDTGSYRISWDGGSFTSGVYFYRLQAGDYRMTRKMVLLK